MPPASIKPIFIKIRYAPFAWSPLSPIPSKVNNTWRSSPCSPAKGPGTLWSNWSHNLILSRQVARVRGKAIKINWYSIPLALCALTNKNNERDRFCTRAAFFDSSALLSYHQREREWTSVATPVVTGRRTARYAEVGGWYVLKWVSCFFTHRIFLEWWCWERDWAYV